LHRQEDDDDDDDDEDDEDDEEELYEPHRGGKQFRPRVGGGKQLREE
jgi:hypothetical protein